jgi:uncharacterized membrane protein YqiK
MPLTPDEADAITSAFRDALQSHVTVDPIAGESADQGETVTDIIEAEAAAEVAVIEAAADAAVAVEEAQRETEVAVAEVHAEASTEVAEEYAEAEVAVAEAEAEAVEAIAEAIEGDTQEVVVDDGGEVVGEVVEVPTDAPTPIAPESVHWSRRPLRELFTR